MITRKSIFASPLRASRLPSVLLSVNRDCAIAAGLQSLVCNFNAAEVFDLAINRSVTTPGTLAHSPVGASLRDWALAGSGATELDFTSGSYTIGVWVYLTGVNAANEYPAYFGRVIYTNESSNSGWLIGGANDGTGNNFRFQAFRNNGIANYALTSTSVPAAGLWHIVGTSDGTTRTIYVNGRSERTTTNNANPLAAATTIANLSAATTQGASLLCYAWNRCLQATEVARLYAAQTRWEILSGFRQRLAPAIEFIYADKWHPMIEQPYLETPRVLSY